MIENTLQVVPDQKPEVKSTEVLAPELPSDVVSDKEADEAAKSLGMSYFSAAKARKLKKIGLFSTQVGVVHLGVGRLAASDEALQRLLESAVKIAEDEEADQYIRVGSITAARGLIDAMQKSVTLMVELQTQKLIGGPDTGKKRSFVAEQPVVPIKAESGSTINVNVVDKSLPAPENT